MMMEKMGFVITSSFFPYGLLNPPAAGQEKNLIAFAINSFSLAVIKSP